jgi:hypothetical protein
MPEWALACGVDANRKVEEDTGNHPNRPPRRAGIEPRRGESSRPDRPTKGETMKDLDAHCRRTGCHCDHIICYRGWIDTTETRKGIPHDVTNPCQYCRPSLHARHWNAQAALANGYPGEAVHRILRESTP